MNYSLNHYYLQEPIFDDLKGSKRTTTLIVLSAIRHFTQHIGFMDLYGRQFAEDIGVHRSTLTNVLKLLVEKKYIKVIRAYQRVGNIPNRYVSLKVVHPGHKVVHTGHKVVHTNTQRGTPEDTVNNSKRIINRSNDGFNKPHPSLIKGSIAWVEAEEKKLKEKE